MDIFKRLAFLHQLQNLLINLNKDHDDDSSSKQMESEITSTQNNKKTKNDSKSLVKLNSFYGYLIKEIAMKHNIQILNCDPMKLFRCKRCYCQYDFDSIMKRKLLKRKTKHRFIEIECPQCSYKRKIIFRKQNKTQFEKYLHKEQELIIKPK